jgi:hypothetical protein
MGVTTRLRPNHLAIAADRPLETGTRIEMGLQSASTSESSRHSVDPLETGTRTETAKRGYNPPPLESTGHSGGPLETGQERNLRNGVTTRLHF